MKSKVDMRAQAHVAHQDWLDRIQLAWEDLENNSNSVCVDLENEVKANKKGIRRLTDDNQFELNALARRNDYINTVEVRVKGNVVKNKPNLKKIEAVEEKIRYTTWRRDCLSQWGFNSYVISFRIKVRLTEELIDMAQRLKSKPDPKMEIELIRLK